MSNTATLSAKYSTAGKNKYVAAQVRFFFSIQQFTITQRVDSSLFKFLPTNHCSPSRVTSEDQRTK